MAMVQRLNGFEDILLFLGSRIYLGRSVKCRSEQDPWFRWSAGRETLSLENRLFLCADRCQTY